MEIKQLQNLYAKLPQIGALAESLENNQVKTIFLDGLLSSAAPMMFSSLFTKYQSTVLFILNDADEAGYFYHDLIQVMGEDFVLYFPSSYRRAVKYGQRDSANEILRTEVLSRLASDKKHLYVVTYPDAVGELVVSRRNLDERTVALRKDQTADIMEIEKNLLALGFEEVDYVYEPGQFAIRGSILDVYSYSSEYPFRVDFFGDDIDSIRTFEVETQLSKDNKDSIEIVPELNSSTVDKVSLMKFLPENTIVVYRDFLFVRDSIDQTYQDGFSNQAISERLESATEQEKKQIYEEMNKESQLISGAQFTSDVIDFRRIEFAHTPSGNPQTVIKFNVSAQPLFHKNFEMLQQALEEYIGKGYQLYILADSQKQNQRLRDIFDEMANTSHTTPLAFTAVDKTLHEGFADDDLKICFFTDHQIFDRYHKYNLRSDKARSGKVALSLKEINELSINDYIVHVDHGIGRFGGLVRVPQGDGYQEMVRIVYQNNDVVFVSIHSLYKISKYKGKDGEPPRLSRLGTGAWENMKERTKKKLKDIARDLIKLYSRRKKEKGFSYSVDSFMQHELEASFLYEDTPDQLKATNDVKSDMEKARPMDRLVCGDVGFGKTEVAVRAAFKAAADSKQVAVLVPTTVLAYQHYKTFSDRLKDFPVRVDYLSRARSAKQTKEVLADLESGKVDILIGTHKLIGKSVKFKDLGLLIIDEEQKFGVSTKEKLRQMKVNVDTLTMSATPIPRTLQFSLMGARDMSVIQTPPPNRYPIQTEVHTFSSEIIADAINFEMSRNGQVFFVSNRISSLA
jgi:transcription-repair coupling factor (superfamily II helicase)